MALPEIYIDFDRDGFHCVNARPGDGLNIVPNPLTLSYKYQAYGVGVTISRRFTRTAFGLKVWTVQTTSSNNRGIVLLNDAGGTGDLTVTNGRSYRVSLWVSRFDQIGGGGSDQFILEAVDQNGVIASTSILNSQLNSDFQRFNLSFNCTLTTNQFSVNFRKGTGTGNYTLELGGLMIVENAAAYPNGFNVGDSSNPYDRITDFVTGSFSWQLGKRPFETMADESEVVLPLANNRLGYERWFSPEYTGHPLEGKVRRFCQVAIDFNSARQWTGYIDSIHVATNRYNSEPIAEITCKGMKAVFEQVRFPCPLYEQKRADEIVEDLLWQAKPLIIHQISAFVLDDPIYGTLDDNFLGGLVFNQSQEIVPIFGDNTQDSEDNLPSLWQLITQIMDLEGGLFWIDSTGSPRFTARHTYESGHAVSIFINDIQEETEYYTLSEDLVSRIEVKTYIRKPSQGNANLVFSLPTPITLAANESIVFTGQFKDSEGLPIGAKDLQTPGGDDVKWLTGGGSIALQLLGQAVIITVTAGGSGGTLSVLNIRGRTYEEPYPITINLENANLVGTYGDRVITINTKAVGSYRQALSRAQFELWRRDWFLGRIASIKLSGAYDSTDPNLYLPMEVLIQVSEYNSAHTGTYRVVGYTHTIDVKNGVHEVIYRLEPCPVGWNINAGSYHIGDSGLRIGIPA